MVLAIGLVIAAAVLQGVFLLPMSRIRDWQWEHSWFAFSVAGMVVGNWILTFVSLPSPMKLYSGVPAREIVVLAAFGLAWGSGAVLFGIAMDMLGLTLGYPLIMGLNASVGTLVPMLWSYGDSMLAGRRILIVGGTAVAIAGIAACSVAGARRESAAGREQRTSNSRFVPGLLIAIASGVLSCLPSLGLTYGSSTLHAAHQLGAAPAFASNSVWFIFFTFGGIVNMTYCGWLIARRGSMRELIGKAAASNWSWAAAMGAMWIGSFYLYGIGTAELGKAGGTIGWPIFVSLSIGVGVLCGLSQGEWRNAPRSAKHLLWAGLALIAAAVLIIPLGAGS